MFALLVEKIAECHMQAHAAFSAFHCSAPLSGRDCMNIKLKHRLPVRPIVVAGLFGLSFSLAACVITEEVPYQGSTESISAQAAGAEKGEEGGGGLRWRPG